MLMVVVVCHFTQTNMQFACLEVPCASHASALVLYSLSFYVLSSMFSHFPKQELLGFSIHSNNGSMAKMIRGPDFQ